ncbi:MAG: serpin family protein [Verrucomicrobiae bacterium]|nr:serpin family protein [Verrucomicrobiae bacterium]NNJ43394.1 serpin family protein [Akkermansiaceae bacterium]
MKTNLISLLAGGLLLTPVAQAATPAATATNQLGLDLYRLLAAKDGNLCLSPYSIQSAFAMTTNGADGKTLQEMRKVLHYPENLSSINDSFASLCSDFEKRHKRAATRFEQKGQGESSFQLMVANRLFGQKGYPFSPAFLQTVEKHYQAPLQLADFKTHFDAERMGINKWVENQTRERIKNLLPSGSLDSSTRLVLVNALYFKAGWRHPFRKSSTTEQAFHLSPERDVAVPTMTAIKSFGFQQEDGYRAVTLPYSEGFAMLVLIPDETDGLTDLEKSLTADKLASLAQLRNRRVALHLPKFKIEGPSMPLKLPLQQLGMKLAFEPGQANFGRMISDESPSSLCISDAYHKTFIAVDEKGTEAAAATAVAVMMRTSMQITEQPIEVRVDRPFFYAIMDTTSRTALFVGRVTDPR